MYAYRTRCTHILLIIFTNNCNMNSNRYLKKDVYNVALHKVNGKYVLCFTLLCMIYIVHGFFYNSPCNDKWISLWLYFFCYENCLFYLLFGKCLRLILLMERTWSMYIRELILKMKWLARHMPSNNRWIKQIGSSSTAAGVLSYSYSG